MNDKNSLYLGYSPTLAAVNNDQHKFYNAVDFYMETMETDVQVYPHKKFKNINLMNKQPIQWNSVKTLLNDDPRIANLQTPRK